MRRPDNRFDKRLEIDFPVSVVGREGHRMSRALNVSSGGVLLERDADSLGPGAECDLDLRLPEVPGPVGCAGTVVYARGPVAGVQFTKVPPIGQSVLDAFIAARLAARRAAGR